MSLTSTLPVTVPSAFSARNPDRFLGANLLSLFCKFICQLPETALAAGELLLPPPQAIWGTVSAKIANLNHLMNRTLQSGGQSAAIVLYEYA
jgi:hypothetical protein